MSTKLYHLSIYTCGSEQGQLHRGFTGAWRRGFGADFLSQAGRHFPRLFNDLNVYIHLPSGKLT